MADVIDNDTRIKSLIKLEERLWGKKDRVNSLNQEIAQLYYPERASFTQTSPINADLAADLQDSITVRCRRDLGNAFSSMLRPRGQEWFYIKANIPDTQLTQYGRDWLYGAAGVMRRVMYDRRSR